MFNFTITPPLSLYIHIPWCVRKCPYCDFNSHEAREGIPERAYIEALMADLEASLPEVWGRPVNTVFFGGGTPSLFSPEAIDRLLAGIRARLQLQPGAEITLEANPGTVDHERFQGFRDAGINRLSIGVQSFQPDLLEKLGRIHNARDAIRAVEAAHHAGFENFNLDLMFGLPGQTLQQARNDLRTAVDLEPAHLSWYELTIEPNTWFYSHPPALPTDDAIADMQDVGRTVLEARGFRRYEVSAWARGQRACKHNLNYWQFGDYLGIGAGAHGKITDTARQNIVRTARIRHPQAYLDGQTSGNFTSSRVALRPEDAILEFVMNALRLDDGFRLEQFTLHTGLPSSALQPAMQQALDAGLLLQDDDHVRPAPQGQRYLNELLQYWMHDARPD